MGKFLLTLGRVHKVSRDCKQAGKSDRWRRAHQKREAVAVTRAEPGRVISDSSWEPFIDLSRHILYTLQLIPEFLGI